MDDLNLAFERGIWNLACPWVDWFAEIKRRLSFKTYFIFWSLQLFMKYMYNSLSNIFRIYICFSQIHLSAKVLWVPPFSKDVMTCSHFENRISLRILIPKRSVILWIKIKTEFFHLFDQYLTNWIFAPIIINHSLKRSDSEFCIDSEE